MTSRLVCLGNVVIDVTASVPALPERGGDVLAQHGALRAGGSGFNVMAAASRLGTASAYAGLHGTGPFGALARDAMAREQICILLDPHPDADTGWDVALTDAGGERTFVTVRGAEAALSADHLASVSVQPGDAVYVSGYGLLSEPGRSAITGWLDSVPEGVTVLFDPGPLVAEVPPASLNAVLAHTDWLSCNLTEATTLSGEIEPQAAARALAQRLSSPHGGVLVRLGPEGCVLAPAGAALVTVPGIRVEAVDTNGAGDAHVGAFLASLLAGYTPEASAHRANAAAALAVTRPGPATGPSEEELDRFLTDSPVK